MNVGMNQLKSLISSSKPTDRLVISIDSLQKNSYQICQKEIDKFIKKDQDYVVLIIKR